LRDLEVDRVLRAAFVAGQDRFGFRLVHYSIQKDHLHLIVEATDRAALSKGLHGLFIRVARALNRLWQRKGKVFADRYHDRILATPREVRNALAYVLGNARKHGQKLLQALDRFTSAPWFEGWKERVNVRGLAGIARPVAAAKTWLLNVGWQLHGPISVWEAPKSG
jgi:REP element-mobilizing transposase RayT